MSIQNLEGYDIYLEIDSLEVVHLLKEEGADISEICWVADEIRILLAHELIVSINFIRGEANCVAHLVARSFSEE